MTALEDVRAELVGLWGRLSAFWGVPPAVARVHAHLLASDGPVDGETLADELEMSRGAVSMACRELVDWGLVRTERPPGDRRMLYSVEDDPERAIRGIVRTRKRREWDPILEHVRTWNQALRGERSRPAARLRQRLAELEGMVALVDSMADSFLRGGIVSRVGLRALVAAARGGRRTQRHSPKNP